MTITDLINLAREKAELSPLSEAEQESDKRWYDLYLEDILEERDWLFSYARSEKLTLTEPTVDLGYKYVYVVGNTDILDIITINHRNLRPGINYRESIRYGFTTDPIEDLPVEGQPNFVFINGLLHSSVPVTQFFYKRKVTPATMKASFRILMIYTLAEHLAKSSAKPELEDRIKRKKDTAHLRACRDEMKRPSDPQLAEIYDWIRSYRKQAAYRY